MSTLLEERPAVRDPEVTVRLVTEEGRGGGGGGRRFGGGNLLTTAGLGAIAIAVLLVVSAITGLVDFGGIFGNTTTTTSSKVLLKELRNLSSYNAAQGVYTVDITHHTDVPVLPNFIAGETIVFRAVGTVDSEIDFSVLATDAVQVGASGDSVTIDLAPPGFGDAVIDPGRSKVVSWSRGLANRIGDAITGDPDLDRVIYAKSEKQIAKAARESGLTERARANTEKMLKGFLARLGFDRVTITWTKQASATAKANAKK